VLGTDCIGNCKSNYHTITAAKGPYLYIELVYVVPPGSFKTDNYYIYYIIIDTYHLLRPLYHEDVPGNVGLFQDNQTDLYF
jgi:hypothetical protein